MGGGVAAGGALVGDCEGVEDGVRTVEGGFMVGTGICDSNRTETTRCWGFWLHIHSYKLERRLVQHSFGDTDSPPSVPNLTVCE